MISNIKQQNNTISFQSDRQLNMENLSNADLYRLANIDDKYIKTTAINNESQNFVNDPMRKVEKKTSQAIPIVDTLLNAALTPGDFGDKVFTGISRAFEWGIFIKITDALSKKLNQNEKYRNFTQEHPATASLISSIAVSTVGIAGYLAIKTGISKVINRYKPLSDFKQAIRQDLNSSLTGQKISGFANKNAKFTKIAAIAGLIGISGLFINELVSLSRIKKQSDKKSGEYDSIRVKALMELNKRLISAQFQPPEE